MSFDPFGDFQTAGYLRNLQYLKDPVEVKESEHFVFELSIDEALSYLEKQKTLDYTALLKTHEILFSGFIHGLAKTEMSLFHIWLYSRGRTTIRATRLSSTLPISKCPLTMLFHLQKKRKTQGKPRADHGATGVCTPFFGR